MGVLRAVAGSSSGGAAGSIVVGNPVTGGAAYAVLREDGSQNLAADSSLLFGSAAAGHGLQIAPGTAVTDVPSLLITRTNNNAAVATGVDINQIDTLSSAGYIPFQLRNGATGLFQVGKAGIVSAAAGSSTVPSFSFIGDLTTGLARQAAGVPSIVGAGSELVRFTSTFIYVLPTQILLGSSGDLGLNRTGVSTMSLGNNTPGNTSGTLQLATLQNGTKTWLSGTAPTIASGFGTSPSISSANGTGAFTLTIGSSTTGVSTGTITMPAATTGWVCTCQNVTNPASFVVGQTGGSSTTITLTNYSRTTGLAVDFTAADVIRIMAIAY